MSDVVLSTHARFRIRERGLDQDKVENIAAKVLPMLTRNTGQRFFWQGHGIVAQKAADGSVLVVTAWKERKKAAVGAMLRKQRKERRR